MVSCTFCICTHLMFETHNCIQSSNYCLHSYNWSLSLSLSICTSTSWSMWGDATSMIPAFSKSILPFNPELSTRCWNNNSKAATPSWDAEACGGPCGVFGCFRSKQNGVVALGFSGKSWLKHIQIIAWKWNTLKMDEVSIWSLDFEAGEIGIWHEFTVFTSMILWVL